MKLDDKALERLHNSKDFLSFLDWAFEERELYIKTLHSANTETIQQIAGRILALDELLLVAKYQKLKDSFRQLEQ